MSTIVLSFFLLLAAFVGMAAGILLRKNNAGGELRGSCGGPEKNPDCCLKKQKSCEFLPTKNDSEDNSP
jgi:hypothetical protein